MLVDDDWPKLWNSEQFVSLAICLSCTHCSTQGTSSSDSGGKTDDVSWVINLKFRIVGAASYQNNEICHGPYGFSLLSCVRVHRAGEGANDVLAREHRAAIGYHH